jgi:mannose-1-phosphate guanylyltransferase
LADAKGEGFWPLSRTSSPKELLPIAGRKSLLEQTVSRIAPLVPPERVFAVAARSGKFVVLEGVLDDACGDDA